MTSWACPRREGSVKAEREPSAVSNSSKKQRQLLSKTLLARVADVGAVALAVELQKAAQKNQNKVSTKDGRTWKRLTSAT